MLFKKKIAQPKETSSPLYSLQEMLENSEAILGVKPEVLVGATVSMEQDAFYIKEAEELVQQFLRKKVL
ncbi:MAG TPA: hypothetical protein VGN02_07060 [Paenibacillus sp.]